MSVLFSPKLDKNVVNLTRVVYNSCIILHREEKENGIV